MMKGMYEGMKDDDERCRGGSGEGGGEEHYLVSGSG